MTDSLDGVPVPKRYLAIAAISLGTALTIIDGAIANVALPTIARDLHVSASAAVLVVTVYNLVLVMTLLPFSALGDRIGLKRMYQLGQLVFALATAACFVVHDLPTLLAIRAFQAFGGAASLSVMSALIRATYPAKQLGRGFGMNTLTVAIAAAVAPTAGGLILSMAPWPWIFAIGTPFALLSLALGWFGLPDIPPRNLDHPYDRTGAVYCVLTFGLIFTGLEAHSHGGSAGVAALVLLAGLAIGTLFVAHERRHAHPVMPVDLLRLPLLASSLAAAFAFFIAMMLILLSLPFRLEEQFGVPTATVGLMLAAWPVTTMVLAPLVGALADRMNGERLGAAGMAITTVGMVLLARLPAYPSLFDVAWRMSLAAIGSSIFMVPNIKLIIGTAPHHRSAAAGGLQSTTRLVGQTLAASLVAVLLDMHAAEGPIPGYVAAALTAFAAIISVARANVLRSVALAR